ncbi:putative aldouronate transport system permease protein [Paenibacillus sp. UNCCL117]|uniref:carbohydrate ABC transporter permease n=1 Tax=unclassified Paenibacillus TaxID=185978 RepID=UPI00087EAEB1|nr:MULTISPECIES: carbohydrate ABC transporter permease [unclassified Paenibacillus]SDD63950.1 putative aldouronate transport system permease protein [Paenibacillus sp. cl123]SFW58417.1 putative aldouronate transport system permease protein [Paenibacillus sp. UNCCL117]
MKVSLGEKIFYGVNYVVLSLAALTCILPLFHIVSLSLSSSEAITLGQVGLWPIEFSLEAYSKLISGTDVLGAFKNSVVITVVGTVLNMLFTILTAYPLSRSYFYGRRFFTLAIVFTMLFTAGLIPNYLLIKQLGLLNSYFSLWLPALISAYNLLILRTFFENVPAEIEEAARMDGCGEWRIIFQIVMPLSLPVIATVSLFYGVNHWNAFFNVLIYINDPAKANLSVLVQNMIRSQSLMAEMAMLDPDAFRSLTPESIKSAGIIVMVLPMLIVYPFLQKYFVKGVLIGSVKG